MAPRSIKMNALVRYITGHAGLPMVSWRKPTSWLDMPWPYTALITSDRKTQRWMESLRDMPRDRISMAIRYDAYVGTVDEAMVLMRLSDAVKLLEAHYKTIKQGTE